MRRPPVFVSRVKNLSLFAGDCCWGNTLGAQRRIACMRNPRHRSRSSGKKSEQESPSKKKKAALEAWWLTSRAADFAGNCSTLRERFSRCYPLPMSQRSSLGLAVDPHFELSDFTHTVRDLLVSACPNAQAYVNRKLQRVSCLQRLAQADDRSLRTSRTFDS